MVWNKIASEKQPHKYFLVLEDDVRFTSGWLEEWYNTYEPSVPEDAEILYLGGVLPPNKQVYSQVVEPASNKTTHWVKIKPNTYFSREPTTNFHFCAYSYILTQQGAKKIMEYLNVSELKAFTISDHLLAHIGLKRYVTNPLLSRCFQEDDPVYVNSQFDNLHREDTFDSDIWNNKECFSEEELLPFKISDT
jgi:GR25 family glycosyltransferase involved in LPS biosynthesis